LELNENIVVLHIYTLKSVYEMYLTFNFFQFHYSVKSGQNFQNTIFF